MDDEAWKILVVEDDRDDYFLTREMLAQASHRCRFTWAQTASAGREALREGAFDAVLMDENLPDGSGLALIREAVAAGIGAPIIMLTGQGSYALDVEAMRAGAADYLSKNEVTGLLLERAIRYSIERKQAETEREQLVIENESQRNLLQSILEVDPGGIALVSGPELAFQFANPAYRALTPHPKIDPVGQPYARIWPEELDFFSAESLQHLLQSGQPAHLAVSRTYSDGAQRSFTAHAYPLTQSDLPAVLLVIWESAARNAAAPGAVAPAMAAKDADGGSLIAINSPLAELGRIFASISHALLIYGPDGTPVFANPTAVAILGFDPTGIPRQELDARLQFRNREGQRLRPEQWPAQRALAGETLGGQHLYVSGVGGPEHLVIVSSAPLNRDGAPVSTGAVATGAVATGAVVIWHPFSEHELSESELRAAQARMDGLLQALPVAVWIVDAQGQVIARNAPADRLWAGEAPIPEHFERYGAYKLFDAETGMELPAEERPLERAILQGKVTSGKRFRIQRLDGTTGVVLAFAGPIRQADGETLGGVVIDLDITEQARLERITLDQKLELERSNQDLQDFASIVSHDLKEPLRKITGFGELLVRRQREHLTDEGRDYIARMTDAAGRMQHMIDDLLTYSRVSTRTEPFQEVDLNQVTHEALQDLDLRIEQSSGQVLVDSLPTIQADPNQMKHLLQNLIGNALKFHRPDTPPQVRVQARPLDSHAIELAISDNGIGFDQEGLGHLFQPFSRLHGRGEYEGSGMGLAICRKIAERHGGSITARSRPGEGSEFIVVLPRKQPENQNRQDTGTITQTKTG